MFLSVKSPVVVCAEPGDCAVVIRDVRCRNSRPFYCPRLFHGLFVRAGWDANANRSEATRVATAGVRGPDGPGSRTFGLPIGATSGARRSIIIVCRRADPRDRVSRTRSAGPAGGAVRGRGSEPLCRPPSVEPRYNMNYLSNRNPNQPSDLHCTPPRPRAVSSVEIGDSRYRDS